MNIAIIRRNGLGDLLCTVPLLLHLKKKFPSSDLTLFVDKRNASLIPYLPPMANFVVFPSSGNKYWNHLKLAIAFRKKFDLAISAKTAPMKLMNLFLYGLKAKESIAYVDKSWHARLINRPVAYNEARLRDKHQALKCLNLVEPGLEDIPHELYPTLHVPQEIKQKYPLGQSQAHPIVLISATTTLPSNRFDAGRYGTILNRLYHHSPFSVRIIAQKADHLRAEAIKSNLQMPSSLYFPRNFDEFMVLLEGSDLYFVSDGGVGHIGSALGKKVIVLFGGSSPLAWRPLGKKVETFYHPLHVDRLSDRPLIEALKRSIEEY